MCVSNVICSIVFGDRFEYDDKDYRILLGILNVMARDMSSTFGQVGGINSLVLHCTSIVLVNN